MVIKLHSFGVIDPSLFVVKVDLFLDVANLPYEIMLGLVDSLKILPKKVIHH
jgi:hypothetical protein